MKPKINPFWGLLTLVLLALTFALCILGANRGVLTVKTDARPEDTAESFFEALEIGKYETANALMENYSGLGLENSPVTERGVLAWDALRASYDYELEGECRVQGDRAVQTVRFRYLDLAALEEELNKSAESDGEEGETSPAPAPTLEELLAQPERFYVTVELPVTLHFVDGQWLVYVDDALLTALSGGKA